jgi:hypothetical protein
VIFNGSRVLGVLATIFLAIIAGTLLYQQEGHSSPKFPTEFQAILLSTGQVYYGKLEGFGTAYPVLRDVFYVKSQADPNTKQVTNILVRRGSEWHGPDRMYINPASIIVVEPVSQGSQVAKLIAEQQRANGQ